MSVDRTGLVELALVFGVVLLALAWELRAVKRALRRDRERAAARESVADPRTPADG